MNIARSQTDSLDSASRIRAKYFGRQVFCQPAALLRKALPTFLRFSLPPLLLSIARFLLRPLRHPFFCHSFSWALLQANSCVRQLRGFCFPGSALHTIGFPPIKQPLALDAEALAFGCPRKNGAEKGDIFMSYLYVKWNSFSLRFTRRRLRH